MSTPSPAGAAALVLLAGLAANACAGAVPAASAPSAGSPGSAKSAGPAGSAAGSAPSAHRQVLVGPSRREQIEAAAPEWARQAAEAHPDAAAARALLQVPRGAEVLVFLGTWCSDSKREVARLWRALDDARGGGAREAARPRD